MRKVARQALSVIAGMELIGFLIGDWFQHCSLRQWLPRMLPRCVNQVCFFETD
jgi:hypothetical protein